MTTLQRLIPNIHETSIIINMSLDKVIYKVILNFSDYHHKDSYRY